MMWETQFGITEGGNDGGADGIYFLVNQRQLVTDDTNLDPKGISKARLIFFQVKHSGGIKPTEIEKWLPLTAEIFFGDAAHMRSDHAGRTWGKRGETPIVETTGARHRMSLISAITARGHMRFMIKEKGGVNAAVFIEFLKRLMAGAKRAIFLIVDRGPAHIAKKTRAFVDSQHGRLRLFFLPPYSPDRNPDELVWNTSRLTLLAA